MKQLQQVIEWHEKFKVPIGMMPSAPEWQRQDLRLRLLNEEVKEFGKELSLLRGTVKMDKVAKELADVLYVLLGTVVEFGLQDVFEDVFDRVHESNMSKLDENGNPIFREDGKILKSNLYKEPDLSFLK